MPRPGLEARGRGPCCRERLPFILIELDHIGWVCKVDVPRAFSICIPDAVQAGARRAESAPPRRQAWDESLWSKDDVSVFYQSNGFVFPKKKLSRVNQARRIEKRYLYSQPNSVWNSGCTKDNLTPFSLTTSQPGVDQPGIDAAAALRPRRAPQVSQPRKPCLHACVQPYVNTLNWSHISICKLAT
jgi:hypothetical protein